MSSTVLVTKPLETAAVLERLSRPGVSLRVASPCVVVSDAEDDLFVARAAQTPGVLAVHRNAPPWPLASKLLASSSTVRLPTGLEWGGRALAVIAGPCAVEDAEGFGKVAGEVVRSGAAAVRAGLFKPRTSPYSFQGLGREGLSLLRDWSARHPDVALVSEVLDPREVEAVAEVAHVLQVGARNMQNAVLLRAVAESGRPVLLKRGFGNTAAELLHSAEYVLSHGNDDVILCERGIRTFEPGTRFTLDVGAIAWIKRRSRLPLIVDPSHAAGSAEFVVPLALAGIAAGADGLIVEVHDRPDDAASDGDQALEPAAFAALMASLRPVAEALGRTLDAPSGATHSPSTTVTA